MSKEVNLLDTVMFQVHDNDVVFIKVKFSCPLELEICIDNIF